MSGGGHHVETNNKGVALLIAVLALFLSFAHIFAEDAGSRSTAKNIESSNLWAFFQAKSIRRTDYIIAAEQMETAMVGENDAAKLDAMKKRIESFRKDAARLDSEPETKEGRKELAARAVLAEKDRDYLKKKKINYEIAAGLLQVAIVLVSAMVITNMMVLAYAGAGLGAIGVLFMFLAQFAPALIIP